MSDEVWRRETGREGSFHDALIAAQGLYARLYALNYASFDDIPDELIAEAVSARQT